MQSGDMIAYDEEGCVGLTAAPESDWYCPKCVSHP